MLIYNGDIDSACNFLGDQWWDKSTVCLFIASIRFVEKLAGEYELPLVEERHPWRLQLENIHRSISVTLKKITFHCRYLTQIAGYTQRWKKDQFTIDVMTVKVGHLHTASITKPAVIQGAGHFVPSDRPGPALQMLSAFLDDVSYDTPINTNLAPLKENYATEEEVKLSHVIEYTMFSRLASVMVDFRSQLQLRRSSELREPLP